MSLHGAVPAHVARLPLGRPVSVRIRGFGWRHAGRRSWAVRAVDLDIAAGERILLLGASGAGKSTLLAALAGLLDPAAAAEHEGEILLDGVPAPRARDRVGMLFQDPETSLVMGRAGDDVAFGLENRGMPRKEIWPRVDAALGTVGFPYGRARDTQALSGGEQQRLALAGALAAAPGLLLLDEPTANLDPEGGELVRSAIRSAVESSGATLILVEHRVEPALSLVDRVVVLEAGGGVAADGSPQDVFARHRTALVDHGVWVPGWRPPVLHAARSGTGTVVARGERLRLAYPRAARPAVADADVDVVAGQALAVTGANGSGKTTLALLLAGLLAPTSGRAVLVDSSRRPLHRWPAGALCRRIGTVFQDPEHQFLTSRVDDELLVGPSRARIAPDEARRRCDELLERLRLARLAGANPFTLSGGEKRRLSVATALATAPDVLVLDEPTFGQDARTWTELLVLCSELRDEGRALVAVTHDEPFVDALADRVVRMAGGRLQPAGTHTTDDARSSSRIAGQP